MGKRKEVDGIVLVLLFVFFCGAFSCLFLICWISSWPKHWSQFPFQALAGFFMFFFGFLFFGGCMSITEEDKDQK